jgi:hypothetical protein
MMFRHPEAVIAELFGVLREFEGIPKRPAGIPAFNDGSEIENGKLYHPA